MRSRSQPARGNRRRESSSSASSRSAGSLRSVSTAGRLRSVSTAVQAAALAASSNCGRGYGSDDVTLRPPPGGYDPTRHGWHDPRGYAESWRFKPSSEPGSFGWMTVKSNDHHGITGKEPRMVAVSEEAPPWFVGPHTSEGPFSTETVPVRRCCDVVMDGNKLAYEPKRFVQGPHLNVQVKYGLEPPKPVADGIGARARAAVHRVQNHNVAKEHHLLGTGCQTASAVRLYHSRHRFLQ
eukprot:TRINITY_DN48554_c1_g1_i1.p1 TRINITY_DN48554_c1_g1~~TRINITY_DN48554_c1_g1_i1.p1  ORF type:complete len:238 (+),score=36.99 TRINITY_DN48554_c1_g1_i1:137-850(+)